MDATATGRRIAVPHRSFFPLVAAPPSDGPPRFQTRVAEAVVLGMIGGWLEMVAGLLHRGMVGTVTRVTVSLSRFHIPLGLLAHLAIFAAWLLLASVLSCRMLRGKRTEFVVAATGWFLALASPLLSIEELHWASSLVLAGGLALKIAPRWVRHRGIALRFGLPLLAMATALVVAFGFARGLSAETRAMAALPPAPPEAPNVVLLVLDTVRADHLGLYGYHRPTTPNLDALASRAIRFDQARSAAPWTLPAHASMFTGRWPHELAADYDRPLGTKFPTLAGFLSRQGYAAGGFVGNAFYCNGWFGVDRGFAHYEDAPENRTISVQQALRSAALTRHLMPVAVAAGLWPTTGQFPERKSAEQINRDALSWIDNAGDRPFFLFLNYIDAHGPYTIPEDFPREYSRLSNRELRAVNTTAKRVPESGRDAALADLRRDGINAYDDCIRYLDEQIARLLDALDRRDSGRETWVIITADHGEHFGEHGKYWHGNSLYRPLIDVPLLIVPPKGSEGRRVTVPVSPRDLPATVADLAGLAGSSPFPGSSLRRHWDAVAKDFEPGEAPLSELKLTSETIRVRDVSEGDRFRAAVVDRGQVYHRDPLGPEELYDQDDREEAQNLAADEDQAEALDRFRDLLDGQRDRDRQR